MFAVIEIGGTQYRVEPNGVIYVNRLETEKGQHVEISQVLLVNTGKDIAVGKPYVESAIVKAKVLDHPKGDKVLVFHKKRRKGYKKLNGHRQYLTKLEIESIVYNNQELKAEKKTANEKASSEE